MPLESAQIEELKKVCPTLKEHEESGTPYIYLPSLGLPTGCQPGVLDALLRPVSTDGYNSRLYFSEKVNPAGSAALNWNTSGVVILQRAWFAFSWRTPAGLRLIQMLALHLKALR